MRTKQELERIIMEAQKELEALPKEVKGWKAFDQDLKCRRFQFEVGKTFEIKEEINPCANGFHFCKQPADVFEYYLFNPKTTRFCEVLAVGDVIDEDNKSVTNKISIIRELSWEEMLTVVNTGFGNTGRSNSGDYNSGNRNSGHYNSGDRNSGDRNSGDYNSGKHNSGFFNTNEPFIRMFNKETKLKRSEISIPYIDLPLLNWVLESNMTEEEKTNNPTYKTTGGYLKTLSYKEAWAVAWGKLSQFEKKQLTDLPNFDAKIFEEITGVKI